MTAVGFDPGGCLKKFADPEEFLCSDDFVKVGHRLDSPAE